MYNKTMSSEITKSDLLNAKSQLENLIVNSKINIIHYEAALNAINEKLKDFPEDKKEDDPMPKEVKDIVEQAQ